MGYEHNDIAIMGGLRAALEEETPMFERNDIVTVYKMNEAIAEGGGGGGSSDLSTATVTITAVNYSISVNASFENYEKHIFDPDEYTIVLYQGEAWITGTDVAEISVSGNAEIIEQEQDGDEWAFTVKVTGDCTVAMTGGSPT